MHIPLTGQPLFELLKASIGYPGRKVLKSVNLKVYRGHFVVFTGPNGAGKTTLLKSIGGVLPLMDGEMIRTYARMGYVPQQENVEPTLPATPRELVEMAISCSREWWRRWTPHDCQFALHCLKQCHAEAFANTPFSRLSGGQRQRVLLARALATRPNVLLLDEPTNGIDRQTQSILIKQLSHLLTSENPAILAVTHDPLIFRNIMTHQAHIDHGKISTAPYLSFNEPSP